jgi:hypothetical protein
MWFLPYHFLPLVFTHHHFFVVIYTLFRLLGSKCSGRRRLKVGLQVPLTTHRFKEIQEAGDYWKK